MFRVPEKVYVPGVTAWTGIATDGEIGGGGDAFMLARFAVSCDADGCRFEVGSTTPGVEADAVSGVAVGVAGELVNDPANSVDKEDAVSTNAESVGVSSEGAAPATGAELEVEMASGLAVGLPSDLPVDFEIGFDKLRFGVELALRFEAAFRLDLDSPAASEFEISWAPDFSSVLLPDIASNCTSD